MRTFRRQWRRPTLRQERLEERLALSATPPSVVDVAVAGSTWTSTFNEYLQSEGLGDGGGYSIPTTSGQQDDSLPWLAIDTVRIKFSGDVLIDASDLSVTGVNQAAYEFVDFSYDPTTDIAQWVFEEPFGNDRILFDLDTDGDDPVRDVLGNLLDGDWTNNVSSGPSGNGIAGGDFQFQVHVLRGDAVNYGEVESTSLWAVYLSNGLGTEDEGYSPQFDLDGDGLIETAEWQYIYAHLYETLPTGSPTGAGDDAPTTGHFDRLEIDDDTVDVAISLWNAFDDLEDSDSELAYAIESVGDPSLFDSYSINATTGELVVNAYTVTGGGYVSGRTYMMLSATDSSGQSVRSKLTLDIHRNDSATSLSAQSTQGAQYQWFVYGTVADSDDDVEDLWVIVDGPVPLVVPVQADGSFVCSFEYAESYPTDVFVLVLDSEGESMCSAVTVTVGW